ncbi:hypothetical protein J4421_01645 [Candidatus Woesearchaeota archaeon]|nr:hypothetical protein [Candidatus Woesearchaeota archaeon]
MAKQGGLVLAGIVASSFYTTIAEGRIGSRRIFDKTEDPSFQKEHGSTESPEETNYRSKSPNELDELQQIFSSFSPGEDKDEGSGSSIRASLSPSFSFPSPDRCAPLFFFRYDVCPLKIFGGNYFLV